MKHTHVIDPANGEMREIKRSEKNIPLIYDASLDGFRFITQKDVDRLLAVATNWTKTRDAMNDFHRNHVAAIREERAR